MKKVKKNLTKLTIPIYSLNGSIEKDLEIPKEIFSIEVNPRLLAQYIRVYQANQRQGTASTKTRGEVSGSTRKIYRQKGTGRARHGDIKAPIFIGGGVVGGPTPRDFSLKINKKQIKKAFFSALSLKFKQGDIIGLSTDFNKMEPKTKLFNQFLNKIKFDKTKVLIVVSQYKENHLFFAARNIKNVFFTEIKHLNPYQILNHKKILLVEEAINLLKR